MSSKRIGLLALAAVLVATVSCSGDGTAVPQAQRPAGLPLSELDGVLRAAAADSDDFLIQQKGAGFGSDLPAANCVANGENADFAPSWSDGGGNSLASAAFAVYRLTYDPLQAPITLTMNWNGAPPTDCWIGLSEWGRSSWNWQPMPSTSTVEVDDPARYVDAQQRCYVAILVLGDAPVSLARIGYGEPPPPLPTGDGYTLFAPLNDTDTYLIDMDGTPVHTWTSNRNPGATAKLLPNGHLLRAGNMNNSHFMGGGMGGRLTEFDWDGNVVWYHDINSMTQCSHHDFEVLPSGNILLIVWNEITTLGAIAAGRNPDIVGTKFWADSIVEIQPTGSSGANIVWEWKVMDHIVQNFEPLAPNYADPAEHPELIDINYPPQLFGDWTHINCVTYNAQFDQIMLCTPNFNEIWVIDHSTTTTEAAGHSGGTYGKGGDLLYRWGNPLAYRQGTDEDQRLYFQHDARWIADGLVGAGEVLIFNNRYGELFDEIGSAAYQIALPQNPDGSYALDGNRYGPEGPSWLWVSDPLIDFYSSNISSVMRLPGGNTFINSGAQGRFFEVNPAGEIVWEYSNQLSEAPAVFRAIRYPYDYPGVAALQAE